MCLLVRVTIYVNACTKLVRVRLYVYACMCRPCVRLHVRVILRTCVCVRPEKGGRAQIVH